MKRIIMMLIAVFSFAAAKAQTIQLINNTACDISVTPHASSAGGCNFLYTGMAINLGPTSSVTHTFGGFFPWTGGAPPAGSWFVGVKYTTSDGSGGGCFNGGWIPISTCTSGVFINTVVRNNCGVNSNCIEVTDLCGNCAPGTTITATYIDLGAGNGRVIFN